MRLKPHFSWAVAVLLCGPAAIALAQDTGADKQYPHPYYWAPFIGAGNPAPLRQFGPAVQ